MTETPTLEVSAWRPDMSELVAKVGPSESWDFEPLILEVLGQSGLGQAIAAREHMRIICTALYEGSAPGLTLSRLTIGQLVSLGASLELAQRRREADSRRAGSAFPRIRADLTLETRHDKDPAEISRVISLQPSRVIKKGDIGVSGKPSPAVFWILSTPELCAGSFDGLLQQLLSQVGPKAAAISSLVKDEVDGVLSLVAYVKDGAPSVSFTVEQLRLIWRLGIQVDVDLLT